MADRNIGLVPVDRRRIFDRLRRLRGPPSMVKKGGKAPATGRRDLTARHTRPEGLQPVRLAPDRLDSNDGNPVRRGLMLPLSELKLLRFPPLAAIAFRQPLCRLAFDLCAIHALSRLRIIPVLHTDQPPRYRFRPTRSVE